MGVKNTVKVMNFHALLRVTDARDRVNDAFRYERELKYIISSIVNNRIFKQEHVSLDIDDEGVELNIYLGSAYILFIGIIIIYNSICPNK